MAGTSVMTIFLTNTELKTDSLINPQAVSRTVFTATLNSWTSVMTIFLTNTELKTDSLKTASKRITLPPLLLPSHTHTHTPTPNTIHWSSSLRSWPDLCSSGWVRYRLYEIVTFHKTVCFVQPPNAIQMDMRTPMSPLYTLTECITNTRNKLKINSMTRYIFYGNRVTREPWYNNRTSDVQQLKNVHITDSHWHFSGNNFTVSLTGALYDGSIQAGLETVNGHML